MSRYSFPSLGSGSDRLSCTPQNQYNAPAQDRRPSYNSQPPSYGSCSPISSCTTGKMSKLASFAHYGGGNRQPERQNAERGQYQCQPYPNQSIQNQPYRNQSIQNQPDQNQSIQNQPFKNQSYQNRSYQNQPNANVPPLKSRSCCPGKNYVPPSFIDSKPRTSNGKEGKAPAERLQNVDVLEELCYYVPGEDSSSQAMDCYNVCNCCGASELIDCGCKNGEEKQPPKPVKYSRRQRFTFQGTEPKSNDRNGPVWPFQRPCKDSKEESGNTRNCHDSSIPNSSCEKILPRQTGIYYFDSTRRMFIAEKDMPKPPEVVYADPPENRNQQQCQAASSSIEEYEILEQEQPEPEIVIQPVIQPIIMPNTSCCNPCNSNNNCCNACNPCNPCNQFKRNSCNPCNGCNPCNPFMNNMCNPSGMGGMGMGGMGPCGPCIPMCIPMCPPAAPAQPPPPPMYPQYPPPPMYPQQMFPQQMFPPQMFPQGPKPKKKKKKKKVEETIIDFEDVPYHSPAKSTYRSPPQPFSPPQPHSSSYSSSGYSDNIVVAGGPAQLFGGQTPPGAFAQNLSSEILVTTQAQAETVTGADGAIITTITFPPGDGQDVQVNTSPSASQLESNINVLANIGGSPTSTRTGANSKSPTSPRSPTPRSPGNRSATPTSTDGSRLSPRNVSPNKNGGEVATYIIPEGSDATIVVSNSKMGENMIHKFM